MCGKQFKHHKNIKTHCDLILTLHMCLWSCQCVLFWSGVF